MGRAQGERGPARDRLVQQRVAPGVLAVDDGRAAEDRDAARGAQALEEAFAVLRVGHRDDVLLRQVVGERVEGRTAAVQGLEVERPHVGHDLVDQVVEVQQRTPAEVAAPADEAALGEVLEVDRQTGVGLSGEEVRAVERAGGGAVDVVEQPRAVELLQRGDHPGGHDAAHPAALDAERDLVRVGVPGASALQHSGDVVHVHMIDTRERFIYVQPDRIVRALIVGEQRHLQESMYPGSRIRSLPGPWRSSHGHARARRPGDRASGNTPFSR